MLCRTTSEDVYVHVCLQTKNIAESPVVWDGLIEFIYYPQLLKEKFIVAATWRGYMYMALVYM